jgi:hypothetical protein
MLKELKQALLLSNQELPSLVYHISFKRSSFSSLVKPQTVAGQ